MSTDQKISILYVDDEEINLFLFKSLFEQEFEVLTSSSGEKALSLLDDKQGKVDVIISDMNMPDMDGLEFIYTAREKHKDIIYFILTGYNFNEKIEEAHKNHIVHQYFSKPFDYNDIATAVLAAFR